MTINRESVAVEIRKFTYLKNRFEDFLEGHRFEVGLSLALTLFGTRALIDGLTTTPGSVQRLPLWLAVTYCVLSVLGGFSVLFGLFCRETVSWAYGVQRFGLYVSGSAWASYLVGLSLAPFRASSSLVILALTALAVCCFLEARAINRKEKATLVALRHATSYREEGDDG